MFLQKVTQNKDMFLHVDMGFRAVPVCFGDDIGIPVCHFVRCRKHSSHSVFSVQKTMCNLYHSVLPLPILSHAVLFSLCLLVLFVNLPMICI